MKKMILVLLSILTTHAYAQPQDLTKLIKNFGSYDIIGFRDGMACSVQVRSSVKDRTFSVTLVEENGNIHEQLIVDDHTPGTFSLNKAGHLSSFLLWSESFDQRLFAFKNDPIDSNVQGSAYVIMGEHGCEGHSTEINPNFQ